MEAEKKTNRSLVFQVPLILIQTFSLPEDRCVRLLVKNLGRQMPASVVQEQLEALGIRVQGVMQLRSG
jgi:hypothetical protein